MIGGPRPFGLSSSSKSTTKPLSIDDIVASYVATATKPTLESAKTTQKATQTTSTQNRFTPIGNIASETPSHKVKDDCEKILLVEPKFSDWEIQKLISMFFPKGWG